MKDSFPRPYQNEAKVNNSIMEYVPFDNGDTGNRKSNMPSVKNSTLSLDHVSNRKI